MYCATYSTRKSLRSSSTISATAATESETAAAFIAPSALRTGASRPLLAPARPTTTA